MKKGNISHALEEAINGWIETESQKLAEDKRGG
jgi:hypothetical protein